LIITPQKAPGKPNMPYRFRPSVQEGQYIRYRLNLSGKKLVEISRKLGLHPTCTRKVVCGLRRSSRIEAEVARILGKASWNEVVLEARSEIQKKPVNVIIQEMEQKAHNRKKAADERMTIQIAQRRSELGWDQPAAQKQTRRRA